MNARHVVHRWATSSLNMSNKSAAIQDIYDRFVIFSSCYFVCRVASISVLIAALVLCDIGRLYKRMRV